MDRLARPAGTRKRMVSVPGFSSLLQLSISTLGQRILHALDQPGHGPDILIGQFRSGGNLLGAGLILDGSCKRLQLAGEDGGFAYAQGSLIRELLRDDNRPPFETFEYGSYADTSRHFLKLDRLSDYLRNQGVCRVESSNFFIAQPMRFLTAIREPCGNPETVAIDYCTGCGGPVEWFELMPRRLVPATP
jgi:hypothetical protein